MKSLVILTGPKAVGKSTLAKKLMEERSDFSYLVKATTRERRPNEGNDEYLFLTEGQFIHEYKQRKIIFPHIGAGSELYGISSPSFFSEDNIFQEKKVVCINDFRFAFLLRHKEVVVKENIFEGQVVQLPADYSLEYDKILLVYVDGDKSECRKRLIRRDDNITKLERDLLFNMSLDLTYKFDSSAFDCRILNKSLDEAYSELIEIVKREID